MPFAYSTEGNNNVFPFFGEDYSKAYADAKGLHALNLFHVVPKYIFLMTD